MSRASSFGQDGKITVVERLGVWLSGHQVRKLAGGFADRQVADVGCGFDATFTRTVIDEVGHVYLADVALADDLIANPKVTPIIGLLPGTLSAIPDGSLDLVLCLSVIEHLADDSSAIAEFHRILKPGGTCIINVPSWLGKRALEFAAFRLGLSTAEMDDHKRYYDPKDIWPLLVSGGFPPHGIRCRRHKFGLNTIARCKKEEFIT